MKKWMMLWICLGMLSGCAGPTFETLGRVDHVSATQPPMGQFLLQLPKEAAVLSSAGENSLYICDGYTLALQTFSAGDLNATVRLISGYSLDQLTVIESGAQVKRYDLAWTAVGETGHQICRAAILSDGLYHYTLTLMADAEQVVLTREAWEQVLSSFCLQSESQTPT